VRFLLDVNVLIALAFPSHSFHAKAHSWFHRDPHMRWATCPLTQAGFVRLGSRELRGKRDAVQETLEALEENCQTSNHEFWPFEIDLCDLSDSERSRLSGPNQIADMQLLMLAHHRRGQLATFDAGINDLASGTRFSKSLLVL
jgi:uncharacterized protein